MSAIGIAVLGASYAAVPLYRLFCQVRYHFKSKLMIHPSWRQASGYGGTVAETRDSTKIETMVPVAERQLTIR